MAGAIIRSITIKGIRDILVSEPREIRRQYIKHHFAISTTDSNKEVATVSDIIILAVKPQDMKNVLDDIGGIVTDEKTVVSIAAGITLAYLSKKLKTKKLIRVMPNTPAFVQEGISVMSLCDCFSDRDISVVKDIFMSIGDVLVLPEKYMDAVTAISGSGPAFFALFIESMIEGGVRSGLHKEDAVKLAVQTAAGTSKLLDSGISTTELIKMVTSPGGTTEAGLKVLQEKNFNDIIIAAVAAAKKRAKELGENS